MSNQWVRPSPAHLPRPQPVLQCAQHQVGVRAAGGRLATGVVDGFRLDRGFQVLNTSYPQVRRRLDLAALDVGTLTPGALVRTGDRLRRVVNPLRVLRSAPATVAAGVLGPADLARLGVYSASAGFDAPARIRARADVSAHAAFRAAGLSETAIDRFLRPFLAGVLLETELATSRRFVDLVWRSFVRGNSVLPALGIGQVGEQLATQLPAGTLMLDTPVDGVSATAVHTRAGTIHASAVVVAADPVTASTWLGLSPPTMRAVVTYYHRSSAPVLGESVIVLDGDAGGPVINTLELTASLPAYAPAGSTLISSSVLDPSVGEAAVRGHLERLYGTSTADWDLVARVEVPAALPAFPAGSPMRTASTVDGIFVAGDHRATPSLQGAMASGTAVARAVRAELGGGAHTPA